VIFAHNETPDLERLAFDGRAHLEERYGIDEPMGFSPVGEILDAFRVGDAEDERVPIPVLGADELSEVGVR